MDRWYTCTTCKEEIKRNLGAYGGGWFTDKCPNCGDTSARFVDSYDYERNPAEWTTQQGLTRGECPNCGTFNYDDGGICGSCGEKF